LARAKFGVVISRAHQAGWQSTCKPADLTIPSLRTEPHHWLILTCLFYLLTACKINQAVTRVRLQLEKKKNPQGEKQSFFLFSSIHQAPERNKPTATSKHLIL